MAYSAPTESDRIAGNYDKEGFVDLQWLQSIVKDSSADFYFCGPVPFMKVIYRILQEWGVPAENIHYDSLVQWNIGRRSSNCIIYFNEKASTIHVGAFVSVWNTEALFLSNLIYIFNYYVLSLV